MTKEQRDRIVSYLLRVGSIDDPDQFQAWHDRRTSSPEGKAMMKRVYALSDTWLMGLFDGLRLGRQEARRELEVEEIAA